MQNKIIDSLDQIQLKKAGLFPALLQFVSFGLIQAERVIDTDPKSILSSDYIGTKLSNFHYPEIVRTIFGEFKEYITKVGYYNGQYFILAKTHEIISTDEEIKELEAKEKVENKPRRKIPLINIRDNQNNRNNKFLAETLDTIEKHKKAESKRSRKWHLREISSIAGEEEHQMKAKYCEVIIFSDSD